MTDDLRRRLVEWDAGAWALAAVAVTLGDQARAQTRHAAEEMLRQLGVEAEPALSEPAAAAHTHAQAVSSLLQAGAIVTDVDAGWGGMPDAIVVAQGLASAQGAGAFAAGISTLSGMADRLQQEGVRMLDVGTGVAALAVALAELYPHLTVVGIDVLPRVLELARHRVADSSASSRILLREQSFAELADIDAFDLVWVPAPFLPTEALSVGIARLTDVMKPGGWVVVAHAKTTGNPLEEALNRFKTAAYGGTVLDDRQAEELLTKAGFREVRSVPTPAGAPAITVGRASSSS